MWLSQNINYLCSGVLIIEAVWIIVVEIRRYKKRRAEVNSYVNSIKFQSSKLRYVFSVFFYWVISSIPGLFLFWIILTAQDSPIGLLGLIPLFLIASMPSAYPYYTILIHENKLNGPTFWGWMWRREEIAVKELDTAKTLNNNIGKKIGVLIFYSMGGKKILSLGLNDAQVRQILDLADKAQSAQ